MESSKSRCFSLVFFLMFVSASGLFSEDTFGYISYTSTNIGDDIQAIAAKRLLPDNVIPITREFVHDFTSAQPVPTLINGWFMHINGIYWERPNLVPPSQPWPPSKDIDPLIISFHMWEHLYPFALSEEGIAYFKKHAPIGARDYLTLSKLEENGIPCYFSGCLTLTLDNHYKGPRDDVIYAVDIPPDCLEYLQNHVDTPVVPMTHGLPAEIFYEQDFALQNKQRLIYAEEMLDKYRRAKCVVTARLHAAMPCLAFETPVVLLCSLLESDRMHGLRELCWNCTNLDLVDGKCPIDLDNPPSNPTKYLAIREQLLLTVAKWVDKKSCASYP